MTDVFISYSHADVAAAALLAHRLETEGWKVWWDRSLEAGQNFHRAIQAALDESRCAVVLWSPRSATSDFVLAEASSASNRHVLVPVMIEKAHLPPPFNITQWIDVTSGTLAAHENIERVVRAVRTMLNRDSPPKTELDDAQFQLAMKHFRERHFLAALEELRAVVRRHPEASDARYFLVLCALAGRRPKLLRSERVAEIDLQLSEAVRCATGDASHILRLWAILRYDCYTLNGLREPAPSAAELLARAKPLQRARIDELASTLEAPGNPLWESLFATALMTKERS